MQTATKTARKYYTQGAWEGSQYKFTQNMSTVQIAKILRADFKKILNPLVKLSITVPHYGSINIKVTQFPLPIHSKLYRRYFEENKKAVENGERWQTFTDWKHSGITWSQEEFEEEKTLKEFCKGRENHQGYSLEAKKLLEKIEAHANAYNYDDSDAQTDYFDTRFYLYVRFDYDLELK